MNKKKAGLLTAGVVAALVAASPLAFAHDEPDHDGKACAFTGGDAGAAAEISGESKYNEVLQYPFAGGNEGNVANCSDFLNDNGNGNLSGNQFAVLPPK